MRHSEEITETIERLKVAIACSDESMKDAKNELEYEVHRNQRLQLTERLNTLKWVIDGDKK